MRRAALLLALLAPTAPAHAGLYYSGETYNELPSRWGGFLLDQRLLRQIAVKPPAGRPAPAARLRYEHEAARLANKAGRTADEDADLGALYLRLGEPGKALGVLRPAQRAHPAHFRLAANLGTAWQKHGDLTQAAAALGQAVRLAPGKLTRAEQLHLKLVRLRGREAPRTQTLDDLFGVRFVGPSGAYEPGKLAPDQRKALPAAAAALAQQLALWLPADGRLLWQVAELAGAHGDVATAAAVLDGCVTEFGMRDPALRAHRKAMRAAADKLARARPQEHDRHAVLFQPRSSRPLARRATRGALPAVSATGLNPLAWEVVAETTVDRQARPTFAKYVRELNGRQAVLRGYMQPLGDDVDLGVFLLIENPIGCWYCEKPDVTMIVLVELPEGKSARFTRDRIRVTGKLTLNDADPENFLYTLRDAKVVAEPDE
jgi:tetratricopeptide (TPR) repeat protein